MGERAEPESEVAGVRGRRRRETRESGGEEERERGWAGLGLGGLVGLLIFHLNPL